MENASVNRMHAILVSRACMINTGDWAEIYDGKICVWSFWASWEMQSFVRAVVTKQVCTVETAVYACCCVCVSVGEGAERERERMSELYECGCIALECTVLFIHTHLHAHTHLYVHSSLWVTTQSPQAHLLESAMSLTRKHSAHELLCGAVPLSEKPSNQKSVCILCESRFTSLDKVEHIRALKESL